MNILKLLFLLTITFHFSCLSDVEEIKYELLKVDHGDVFDVVFRITNNTSKTMTLDEPREGTCATLVREWKYVKAENSEWDRILQTVGTAMAPPVFQIRPRGIKEFVLISAWNKKDLDKTIEKEKLLNILFRVWYTSTNEEGVYTNEIELK